MISIEVNECVDIDRENFLEDVKKWVQDNKDKLLQCQSEIRKSRFKERLSAEFQMWDSDVKYYSQWTNCRVTAGGISIIKYGQGDDKITDPIQETQLATVEVLA